VSAGTKPSLTAAKGGAEIVAERQREPGGSRCPHFVSIFWIIVKTGGLGPPITVVRQRLIRRVGFPEKRAENAIRSEHRKFVAHLETLAAFLITVPLT